MRNSIVSVVLGLMLAAGTACAASAGEAVVYAPAPEWVRPVPIPDKPRTADEGAIEVLLMDTEDYYGPNGEEHYLETAVRVATPQGLGPAGTVSRTWDPGTETLVVHKAAIIRDGKVIDTLADDRFLVLRQETNLSMAMLDGRLTATKQVLGLQVGDIVQVASTVRRRDPVLAGNSENWDGFAVEAPVSRVRYRQVWPDSEKIRWRTTDGFENPTVTRSAFGTELEIDRRDFKAPEPPVGAPGRFHNLAQLEISEFPDWQAISRLMAPLYRTAATLAADSPLKAEVEKIRAAHATPEARAAAALRLVQEQVRYFYLSIGEGGYQPARADLTWARKFGDCKGKTALLLALLWELGIEAEPAMVNSEGIDGLEAKLPMVGAFDHILVRATIDGKVYWLDGARLGDRALADIEVPPFRWALPARAAGADLERLEIKAPTTPLRQTELDFDASAGLDAEMAVKIEVLYRREAAIEAQQNAEATPRREMERQLIDGFNGNFDGVRFETATYGYDAEAAVFRITVEGKGKVGWDLDRDSRRREFVVVNSGALGGFEPRKPGPHADAPYELDFPSFDSYRTRVRLPRKGAGFEIVGADVDATVGGVELKRAARIEDGVAVVDYSERVLVPEIPVEEALATEEKLRALPTSQYLLIRAPRNYADGAGAQDDPAKASADDQISASMRALMDGRAQEALEAAERAVRADPAGHRPLMARAIVKRSMGNIRGALADAGQAIRRAPDEAEAYAVRARTHEAAGDARAALTDIERAIDIDPRSPDYLSDRAHVLGALGRHDEALTDLETAIRLAPGETSLLEERRDAALAAGRPRQGVIDQHIAALDRLIAEEPRSAGLYFERAMARQDDREGDKVLADLNRSIELEASAPAYEQRGRMREFMKDPKAALADYNEALRLSPTNLEALAARANLHAEERRLEAAEADVAAMLRIDPNYGFARREEARLVELRGDRPRALRMMGQLIARDRDDLEMLALRARMHASDKAYGKALDDVEAVTRRVGDKAYGGQLASNIAYAVADIGDVAGGVAMMDAYLKDNPRYAEGFNSRCWLKAMHGIDPQGAVADCERALELSPKNADYLDSRGFALLRAGRYRESIASYDEALAGDPREAVSWYGRGVAKRRLGDNAGGDQDIAKGKEISPSVEAEFSRYGLTP